MVKFKIHEKTFVFSSWSQYGLWLEKNLARPVGRASIHLLGRKAQEIEARLCRAKAFGPVGRVRPPVREAQGAVYSF